MDNNQKMREFILSYLDTQVNEINLKTVHKLVNYGKNNEFNAPDILAELLKMDYMHEKLLNSYFEIDFIDGVNLFANHASEWLTESGKACLEELKKANDIDHLSTIQATSDSEFEGYLSQLLNAKNKMLNERDKITLQEFIIELRHLLSENKVLEKNALSKFQPFISRNWQILSTPMMPILVELSRRFLFDIE